MSYVVGKEPAEQAFEEWAEAMDIELSKESMDAEDQTAYNRNKERIIKAIMRGHLTFNDDQLAVYTPWRPGSRYTDPLTFHERTGASLMAADRHKQDKTVTKMYAMLGDMCRVDQKVFSGLVGTDIKVCEAIYSFLMD